VTLLRVVIFAAVVAVTGVLVGLGGFLVGRLTDRPDLVPIFGTVMQVGMGVFGVLLAAGFGWGLFETARWFFRMATGQSRPTDSLDSNP